MTRLPTPCVGCSTQELFETAFHVPLGHPETVKSSITLTPLFQRGAGGIPSAVVRLFVTAFHVPLGHPETVKSSTTLTPLFQRGAGGIPSAVVRLFVTVFHVPLGHPETMKSSRLMLRVFACNQSLARAAVVGWAKRSAAHRNFS